MEDLVAELLERLKKVKGIKGIKGEDSDNILSFALETTVQTILNYCHFSAEEWPSDLNTTAIFMAVDVLNEVNLTFNEESFNGDTKSLTEGDFTIARETKAEAYQKIMGAPSFIRNYLRTLNSFRRLQR